MGSDLAPFQSVSICFFYHFAGYTVSIFWRYPIKRRVTEASALELYVSIFIDYYHDICNFVCGRFHV